MEELCGAQEGGCCRGDERVGVSECVVLYSGDVGCSQSKEKTLVPRVGGPKHNLHTHFHFFMMIQGGQ